MISLATPILLVALGAVISERSGVLNIGTEGMMLSGAFGAMAISVEAGNGWIGVLGGLATGATCGLVLAVWSVTFIANQIIVGIVINLVALGATTFLFEHYFPQTGGAVLRTPGIGNWSVPLLDRLPHVGVIFVQSPLVWIAFLLVPVIGFVLFRTPAGLVVRAVGEGARAADTAGINVRLVRYIATVIGGALAGLGGSYLSLVEARAFQPDMTGGRGFIALAVVMLGRWRASGAVAAALLFGAADALQFRAQGVLGSIPPLTWTLLPYVLTLIVLVGLVGKLSPPAEDGRSYVKEEL